jgi:RNA polymerase sigma-70 factor (ECF subfamily)
MESAGIEQTTLSDFELVTLARQGDHDAFGALTQRHWRKCVDLGCSIVRNRGEAEDQAQTAILKAFEHLDQYKGNAEFSTWLARIVVNQCLMSIRARRLAHFVYLDDLGPDPKLVPIQIPTTDPDPEDLLANLQLNQVLQSEVRRMPPLMRNVMLLRDLQGLPMTSVAEKLGISVEAAKSRLVRARAEMRVRMQHHFEGLRNSSALSRPSGSLSRADHSPIQAFQ